MSNYSCWVAVHKEYDKRYLTVRLSIKVHHSLMHVKKNNFDLWETIKERTELHSGFNPHCIDLESFTVRK